MTAIPSAIVVSSLIFIAAPTGATGFTDISTWSGATPCSEPTTVSCVFQHGDGDDYDVFGTSPDTGTYVITSQTASSEAYISFYYNFEPATGLALAEYSVDGSIFTSLPPALHASAGPIVLAAGQSFSFRLINSGEQPILGISDFSSTPVPAPLPFLGAAASFGWIRARRAVLRARQQQQRS